MRAMLLTGAGEPPREADVPARAPERGQVRIRVGTCGVCRTDLHVVDGELREPKLPLVLGHQVARAEGRRVFAFTRERDTAGQAFARSRHSRRAPPSSAAAST